MVNIAFQSLQILDTFVLRAAGSNFRMQYKSVPNLQTLQGYINIYCGDLFASLCLVLKLVYNGNCLFT